MAKYKRYDYSQSVLIPVSLADQLVPGTLEFAIHTLVEKRMDIVGLNLTKKMMISGISLSAPMVLSPTYYYSAVSTDYCDIVFIPQA